ncbi:MAG TPA: hypothetical protein ENN66_00770 [Proteobacteria bacterium]|mgnify:CR=1 FL=1|nr:hypothetical protein [Pseudomonadota bacterium]
MKKTALFVVALCLLLPTVIWAAHPPVVLYDRQGNRIVDQLDESDTVTAASGSVYQRGPAYSPKQSCGKCHDYQSVTKAYHFREGAGPNGENLSDTWVSENKDSRLNKYLAHAYGHLLSPGQFGAW